MAKAVKRNNDGRKRNPTDITLRNLRSLKAKVERLEFRVTVLEKLAKFK